MEHIVWDKGPRLYKLGKLMEKIGWRQYMKGMISLEALVIQAECVDLGGCSLSLDNWAKGLAIKLLEATHGQWLYINMLVIVIGCGSDRVILKIFYDLMSKVIVSLVGTSL